MKQGEISNKERELVKQIHEHAEPFLMRLLISESQSILMERMYSDVFYLIQVGLFRDVDQFKRLVTDTLRGLITLHTKYKMCHYDLKPENLFCDVHGTYVIGDFGSVQLPTPDSRTIKGTRGFYMDGISASGYVQDMYGLFTTYLTVVSEKSICFMRPCIHKRYIWVIRNLSNDQARSELLANVYEHFVMNDIPRVTNTS